MLRSSHHPYHVPPSHPHHAEHIHVSNPWSEPGPSSSGSSLNSRRHAAMPGPPPAAEWLRPPHHRHTHYTLSHQAPLLNQHVASTLAPALAPSQLGRGSSRGGSRGGSSPGGSTAAGLDSCGGQCVACETFCYYCLQVLFIAGILTGTSLTIAGSVLRGNHRGSDLVVLVYIGVLLLLVCSLLLSVHCCVRRGVKARKRARLRRAVNVIPLQELGPPPCSLVDPPLPPLPERRVYLAEAPARHPHWDQQPYQPLIHRPTAR